jgi:plastocyanin
MKRIFRLIALVVLIITIITGFTACGSDNNGETPVTTTEMTTTEPTSTATETTEPTVGPNEVQITNEGIFPKVLTVPVGTTVTFYNNDSRQNSRHWFKALDGSFDTRALPKHARMEITFNEKGVFEYQCLFHKDREEENGTIIVE